MKQDWEYKKLKDIAEIGAGQGAPQGEQNYCNEGTPFIKAGNLGDLMNGLSESSVQKVSEEVANKHRLKKQKAGSVLFAKSGMSCMKGYVYTLKNDCYVVSHLAIITPFDIQSKFLNYYFLYNKPNYLVQDEAYPSISLKDIGNLIIPNPSIIIQNQVIEELDLLSGIIEKNKKQLEELDKLAQSIFYEMFGDPVTNEKGWEVKQLGKISKIGTGATPSRRKEKIYYGGNIPWVKTTEVQNCLIYDTEEHITDIAIKETNCKIYSTDTILMAMYGQGKTRGQIAILKTNAATNQACAAIMVDPNILNVNFLYELLFVQYDNIRSMAQGGNQENLNMKLVASIQIIIPPPILQKQFAEKIEHIESMKSKVQKSLIEIETLFNSRMDYYFN